MDQSAWIAIGIAVFVLLIVAGMYNSLVRRRNQVENVFGSLDAMLKKRFDLLPNLVATIKQYMQHEAETLTKVTELRGKAQGVPSDQAVDIENQITRAIGGIMVAVEAYPDLKASENFNQLQRSLNEIEEQISASRRAFNATVTDFNNGVESFPSNIIAGIFGFKRRNVFEIPAEERQAPDVNALFNA